MSKKIIKLSLQLFGAVPKGELCEAKHSKTLKYGLVLDQYAAYALNDVLEFLEEDQLNGEQLNATFHKSWKIIKNSKQEELAVHQLLHYSTTYGTNFSSKYIYFPTEKLTIPAIKKLAIRVIQGVPPEELIEKALAMLSSGIALAEETVDALLAVLEELGYVFTTVDHIKNKEALVKIIAAKKIYPSPPTEFLRYLVYLATESTLLIKSDDTIKKIKEAKPDISTHLNQFGLKKCATIFNRFKPLWLAFKSNARNKPLINELNRLSKRYHRPMPVDVLNTITSTQYKEGQVIQALYKVNNFRKIRLLHALNTRLNAADVFLYRIRNGRSFSKKEKMTEKWEYFQAMYQLVYENLLETLSLYGTKIKYPVQVDYSLPASEKMFVGNFPVGTKITSAKLVSGVYWRNEWGAEDLDLSSLNVEGKVGWNSNFKAKGLLYSGDVTDATHGATELLYSKHTLEVPSLSILNIYTGSVGCKFKIIVGKASKVRQNYMFDPNELILEAETHMVGRQQILGIFLPEADQQLSFVLVNAGFGNISVSGNSVHSDHARKALLYQYAAPISFRKLLLDAGATLVGKEEDASVDLMPQQLTKNTFIDLLS
ncbi:MAG: hypothetical protein AAGG75_02055 [Bacteroidota bacterium]